MHIISIVLAILIIVSALLWLLVPVIVGLPPISTKRERIRRALEIANLQPGERLYDLGCGHGGVLVVAAAEFGALAVGIEAGPIQCIFARINSLLNGVSSMVRIEARNFFKTDLSEADVVYAYLTSGYAIRLQEKLDRELKYGARVVTVAFDLPDWNFTAFDRENLIYIYEK